jgi:hypothetical protein
MPCLSSRVAKVAAAISPAKDTAKMFPACCQQLDLALQLLCATTFRQLQLWGERLTCVQDRHPRGNLLACIEQREDVERTRIEWRFDKSKEEPNDDQASVVLDQRCQCSDTAPNHRTACHVQGWPNFL